MERETVGPGGKAQVAEACASDMALVEYLDTRVCMDRYEFPGYGRVPKTEVTHDAAAALCTGLGKRLCSEKEWAAGCRGESKWGTYPYGAAYRPDICNTSIGPPREVAKAGAYAGCVSASGIVDMSGNVAEWIAGGKYTKGGSARDGDEGRCSTKERRGRNAFSDVGFRCCADPKL